MSNVKFATSGKREGQGKDYSGPVRRDRKTLDPLYLPELSMVFSELRG